MKLKSFYLLLFLLLGAYVADVKAVSYGYSLLDPESAPGGQYTIYAETGTVLDYDMWYWYDPGIQGYLFEDGYLVDSTQREMNYNGPIIYLWAERDVRYNSTYRLRGDHYLGSAHYYVSSGQHVYLDRYGFNFYSGEFPTPYSFIYSQPAYYLYRIYRAASTQVTVSTARPLNLTGVDTTGGLPGNDYLTFLRGTGLFGTGQSVSVSGAGVSVTIRPGQNPNTIEVLEVEIAIAPNADPGPRSITLTVNGQTSNPVTFRVGDRSPQVTGISPSQGNAGENLGVTITGSNFGFNPEVEIDGLGVSRTITSSSTTHINAIFTVSQSADPGTRGVKVRSRGVTGTGFEQVPTNSPISNSVPFNVLAASPDVRIAEIGTVEKGSVKEITVEIINPPTQSNHITRLRFRNQTPRQEGDRWITGEARFDDGSPDGQQEISFPSNQQSHQVRIRGWERSSSRDNVKLEARFNNDSDVKRDKSFSVSSIEFVEEAECTGYDDVEFQLRNDPFFRYFYVPVGGSNRLKAKVVPSGAARSFRLEAQSGITVSPSVISNGTEQVVTVTSTSVPGSFSIGVKANNQDASTNLAEVLYPEVLSRKEKNVVVYAVTEDNDDVQRIPRGQGEPDTVAYVFSEGPNNFIDTVAGGDDWLAPVPIGQRPPGYSARSRRVFTGPNGILETVPAGDDERFDSKNKEEMLLYAPVTEFSHGSPQAVCVTSGANLFLDTLVDSIRTDDQEVEDPANPGRFFVTAGANGRCDTDALNTDVLPPTLPNATALQNYLNNTTWGRQANIFFTVTVGQAFEVNFDLNRNGELKDGELGVDEVEAIKNVINDPNAFDLYYVGMRIEPHPTGRKAAFADFSLGNIWAGVEGLTLNTAAHEIGHPLRRTGSHSPLGADYRADLMYEIIVPTVNQCRIRKPDWDLVR